MFVIYCKLYVVTDIDTLSGFPPLLCFAIAGVNVILLGPIPSFG